MKTTINLFVTISLVLMMSILSRAQEWSDEQKAVWREVEKNWTNWAAQDIEKVMDQLHPDFYCWTLDQNFPQDKESLKKWSRFYFDNQKILVYEIKPLVIQINDNVAVVHYLFSQAVQDKNGEQTTLAGRYSDVLMKAEDMWLYLGWYGGVASEENE